MNFRYIFLITGILFFIIGILFPYDDKFSLIVLIPLFFGFFSFYLFPNKIIFTPGFSIFLVVLVIRYNLTPFFLVSSGLIKYYDPFAFNVTFFLIITEMLAIFISIRVFFIKLVKYQTASENTSYNVVNFSYVFPLFIILVSTIWSFKDPSALNRYNFIINSNPVLTITDMSGVSQGLPRLLNYAHFFLIITIFFFFYKRFSISQNKVFAIFGIMLPLLVGSFYTDSSRNSLLIPLLSIWFLSMKYYPMYKRNISFIFLGVLISSMTMLSLMKFFKVKEVSSDLINTSTTALLLDDYFAGYYGILKGVEKIDFIKKKIDYETFVNEIFGTMVFMEKFLDLDNRTTEFYQDAVSNMNVIVPTSVQGYAYFGMFFSWVPMVFIIFLISFFDLRFLKSKKIELSFLYAYAAVKIGWIHHGNLTLIFSHLNYVIVLYLFFKINVILSNLKIKKVDKESL